MKPGKYIPYIAAGITAFCVIACSIFLCFLFINIAEICSFFGTVAYILRPVFLGMVIAFLLLPVHRFFLTFLTLAVPDAQQHNKHVSPLLNLLAILLSFLFAFIILYMLFAMVVPQVYLSVVGLIHSIPSYISQVHTWLFTFLDDNPDILTAVLPVYNSIATSIQDWLNSSILPNLASITSTLTWIKETIMPNITGMVSNVSAIVHSFVALMKDLLIAVIVSVYLLIRKDIFAAQSKKIVYSIFPTKCADLIVEETRSAYRIMSGFINGKLLDSLIIGLITVVCCNLFHFPYPVLIATIIGVTNIIPFFGPFIGAVPATLLIFIVSPTKGIYFILYVFILQQFDGNILGPKILGDSTGLASFWVLFSILLFGGLFGFAGMVMGVPIFAMIYSIIRRLVYRGLRNRDLPINTDYYIGPTGPMS